MFVKYSLDDGSGRVGLIEKIGRPSVYLDHWALNDIALTPSYRQKFTSIMNSRKGTLRLSMNNLSELMNQTDQQQILSILDMIDTIDTGFINTDFNDVVNRENDLLSGKVHNENPSIELRIIYTHLLAQNWPESWVVSDVIRAILNNSSEGQQRESWDRLAKSMKVFLDSTRSDAKYISESKDSAKAIRKKRKQYDRPTRELIQLGLYFVFQNKDMRMDSNEWQDFFHAIVPVAYCDFVLLDKRWTNFISQTGFSFPDVAFVFDRRSIHDFFSKLELETAGLPDHESEPTPYQQNSKDVGL